MKCALADLIKWAQFQFSTSKLITHDAVRIKPLLKNFLRDGKLTREPARQKQWVGCVLIRIMVTSVLNDAMSNGTANWDITVSGVLSTEQMYLGDNNAPFPKNISTLAKLCPKLTFIKGFVKQLDTSRIDCHLCLCSFKANRALSYHRRSSREVRFRLR